MGYKVYSKRRQFTCDPAAAPLPPDDWWSFCAARTRNTTKVARLRGEAREATPSAPLQICPNITANSGRSAANLSNSVSIVLTALSIDAMGSSSSASARKRILRRISRPKGVVARRKARRWASTAALSYAMAARGIRGMLHCRRGFRVTAVRRERSALSLTVELGLGPAGPDRQLPRGVAYPGVPPPQG